jgi:aminoglycoside phosphotransferase (APT) family kinase protein
MAESTALDSIPTPIMRHNRDMDAARRVLTEWLTAHLPQASDVRLDAITTPGSSGVANETLLVNGAWRERGQPREGGFAVRLAARDPFWVDADIHVHYQMYAALADDPNIPVPGVVGYEPDVSLLGSPFFVMERIEGIIPPDVPHYTEGGFVFDATRDQRRQVWEEGVKAMAKVHKADTRRLPFLDRPQLGQGGFRQELNYFRRYLDWARRGRTFDILETGWEWLNANLPTDSQPGLSWGDSRIGNMIYRDFRVVAVLDWDTVSLAGPETDLAWWIQMERNAWDKLDGFGTPDDLVELWESLTGWKVRNLHYHRVFTAFRLGAISVKLADRTAKDGLITQEAAEQMAKVGSGQQLALLLGLTPPGPVTSEPAQLRRH